VTGVLIVENEQDLREVLSAAIGTSLPDVAVFTAATITEADAQCAMNHEIALLLVDHTLGGGETGLAYIARRRAQRPGTRAILFSGHITAEIEQSARAQGVAVLWKPAKLAALIDAVRLGLADSAAAER
jgi:DNA-binding NtrC family response regulator